MAAKRLSRSQVHKVPGGVCGGIAEDVNAHPTVIRLLWILFSLLFGIGVLFSNIAGAIIPERPR